MWGGRLRFTTAMLLRHRPGRRVHDRRPVGRHPRRVAVRHAADRHLLHRRPLPLRAVRRRRLRPVRRLLLLVAEGLRPHAQRAARQVELLADGRRHEPHVRADAHRRSAGPAPAHVPLRRPTWASTFWNLMATIGAFILALGVLALHHQRRRSRARKPAQRPARPVGRPQLRVDDDQPAQAAQLRRHPRRCTRIDEFFHRKYEEDEETGTLQQVATAEEILAEQERNADHAHPPAVAVVLAARRGGRPADHRPSA